MAGQTMTNPQGFWTAAGYLASLVALAIAGGSHGGSGRWLKQENHHATQASKHPSSVRGSGSYDDFELPQ